MRTVLTALVIGLVSVMVVTAADKVDPAVLAFKNVQSLLIAKDYEGTITAAAKFIQDFPAANSDLRLLSQSYAGSSLYCRSQYADAEAVFRKILTDYPSASPALRLEAEYVVGACLEMQNKNKEAQAIFMNCVTSYVWQVGATNEQSLIWQTFDKKINPMLLNTAEYKTYLENTMKAIPATDANVPFIKFVGKALGKMK